VITNAAFAPTAGTAAAPLQSPFQPWAIVVAKSPQRAKLRLDRELGARKRCQLAVDLLTHVLRACWSCATLAGTLVATESDEVARLADAFGARLVRDRSSDRGALGRVVDHALDASAKLGATHALVFVADLPLLEPRDIDELIAVMRASPFVLVPDVHRRGTSALGVRLDLRVRSCFGHADSMRLHTQEALRVGALPRVHAHPRVGPDLDTVDDLALLANERSSPVKARSRR
jgi:2-phospho-L-lactate guanylyltransferase